MSKDRAVTILHLPPQCLRWFRHWVNLGQFFLCSSSKPSINNSDQRGLCKAEHLRSQDLSWWQILAAAGLQSASSWRLLLVLSYVTSFQSGDTFVLSLVVFLLSCRTFVLSHLVGSSNQKSCLASFPGNMSQFNIPNLVLPINDKKYQQRPPTATETLRWYEWCLCVKRTSHILPSFSWKSKQICFSHTNFKLLP